MRLLCSQNLTLECRRHDTQRDDENQAKILQFAQNHPAAEWNPSWQRIPNWHFRQLSFIVVHYAVLTQKGNKRAKVAVDLLR